eukprot:TRINITY_DN17934_c0_g1_i1.p1 TRINITY_DN17934_c0_g1~~TRINITY_DN17934_c0_g1_i1.p1  ORF type:complete len:581 (-),score=131.46 TRINITY_DN17934_c0_g1_i1:50-1684(-)
MALSQGDLGLGTIVNGIRDKSLAANLGFRVPDTVVLEKGRPKRRYSVDVVGQLQVTYPKTSADLLRILRELVQRAHGRRRDERRNRERELELEMQRAAAAGDGDGAVNFVGCAGSDVAAAPTMGAGSTVCSIATATTHKATTRAASAGAQRRSGVGGAGRFAPGRGPAALRRQVRSASIGGRGQRYRSAIGWEDDGSATAEVAMLYYGDSHCTVRQMAAREAEAQMVEVDGTPANKLPRNFWQDIRLLQEPIPGARWNSRPRHITYKFTADNDILPQAHAAVSASVRRASSVSALKPGGRANGATATDADVQARLDLEKVAKVPKLLNHFLRTRRQGQAGFELEIASGQFEFALDEGDGTLWLLSAGKLVCRKLERIEEPAPPPPPEEVKYFDKKEFARTLAQRWDVFSGLKRRFPDQNQNGPSEPQALAAAANSEDVPEGAGALPAAVETGQKQQKPTDVSPADVMPDDLRMFYTARRQMLQFFEEEVRAAGKEVGNPVDELSKAQALSFFFHRWARAVPRKKQRKDSILSLAQVGRNRPITR